MAPWILKDGTKVHLGGVVEGGTFLAEWLRLRLDWVRSGHAVSSGFGPCPHEEPLDLDVDYLLDCYLRRLLRSDVLSGPDVVYPVLEPRPAPPPGAVY